jgi:predicted nucleic acid-binding protein
MQRFVIDTDVVVAGMRSPSGGSSAILLAASEGVVTLLASLPLVLEYEAVCLRPEHGRAAGLTKDEVKIFIDGILAWGV